MGSEKPDEQDLDAFSRQFTEECQQDIGKFLLEMDERHGGITYPRLFEYSMLLQFAMYELYLDDDETETQDEAGE